MSDSDTLYLAEIPYDTGELHFRYARKHSADRKRWIRHGLFTTYHKDGHILSTGSYVDDVPVGPWRDFHENGQLAAEGEYLDGKEHGVWHFWDENGAPEPDVRFQHGEQVGV